MMATELRVALNDFGVARREMESSYSWSNQQGEREEAAAERVRSALVNLVGQPARSTGGVWVVYHFDNNWIVNSVHETEPDALRAAVDQGFGKVVFTAFGRDVSEAFYE